ncbi:hypothetical protein ACM66B_003176 [Microbotryomycetes sp. NB124-2]
MAFSFGTPAASTTPAAKPPTFSFGAPSSTTQAAPSLFGNTQTPASGAQTTSSLFGSTTPASGTTTSTSLFGSTTTAPSSSTPGTSLFGASSAAPGTTSLFGNTATSAASSAPSLFGQSAATPTPGTSTGLFGSQPQQQSTSLFGGQTSSQPGSSTSLFGGGAGGGGLFGSTSSAPPSLFGQQQPATSQPPAAGQPAVTAAPLFGQSQTAATSSLFGSKPASTSTSLFGSKPASGGLFGQSSSLSSSTPLPPTAQPPVPKLGDPFPPPNSANQRPIESRIQDIKSAWDPQDPKCKFQTYFYNEVLPPNKASMYGRPPQGTDERAWQKAVRENPDPEKYVPAIAIGFPSIKQRIEHQQRLSETHQQLLDDIHQHLTKLGQTHSLDTSLRVLRAQQASVTLQARLTKLVARVSPLVAAAASSNSSSTSDKGTLTTTTSGSTTTTTSLSRKEEELRIELDRLANVVERTKTRTNEMWSGVGSLKAAKSGSIVSSGGSGSGGDGVEWAVVDDQGLKQVLDILSQQQAGLDHLTKTLDSARFEVDVMQKAFGLSPSQA